MKKILAIIPARGSSKGIRQKNIRPFAGRPLIAHAIACAKQSRYISRTIVSTDSVDIARMAKQYGAEVPFLRPAELADDKSLVVDAIIHLLNTLQHTEKYKPDLIVLLQTTSPLREAKDIDGAIQLLLKHKAPAVVSICSTEQLLYVKNNKDTLHLVSSKEFLKSTNRQQLQKTYKLDGSMVYTVKTSVFLKQKSFLPTGIAGYEIPRWRAIDLDEPQDFIVGEIIFKQRQVIKKKLQHFR